MGVKESPRATQTHTRPSEFPLGGRGRVKESPRTPPSPPHPSTVHKGAQAETENVNYRHTDSQAGARNSTQAEGKRGTLIPKTNLLYRLVIY
jgi:hypothetical protein